MRHLRQLLAITTPQSLVNDCMNVVERNTHLRAEPVVRGTHLDHFGIVVDTDNFSELSPSFADDVMQPVAVEGSEAGRSIFGLQTKTTGSQLCWYANHYFPSVALVEASPALAVPAGGGYVAVSCHSIRHAMRMVDELGLAFDQTILYGCEALHVHLDEGSDWSIYPSYFGLYVIIGSAYDAARRLSRQERSA